AAVGVAAEELVGGDVVVAVDRPLDFGVGGGAVPRRALGLQPDLLGAEGRGCAQQGQCEGETSRQPPLQHAPHSLLLPKTDESKHDSSNRAWVLPMDLSTMSANQHVFSHGMRDTRATLETWSERPGRVLGAWVALSLAIALALLTATWVVAGLLTPDLTPVHIAGLTY